MGKAEATSHLPIFTLFLPLHESPDIVALCGNFFAIPCSPSTRVKQQEVCLLASVLAMS